MIADNHTHVLHCVINLERSWLIFDVLIRVHDCPRYRSLDLWIFNIPAIERCINSTALAIFTRSNDAEAIAIPLSQSLGIVGEQKRSADAVN